MVSTYVVALRRPHEEMRKRIRSAYPNAYEYTNTLFLIRGDSFTLARDVAARIGLKGEGRMEDASGVVFKLNRGYSGFTQPSLWDWLSNSE